MRNTPWKTIILLVQLTCRGYSSTFRSCISTVSHHPPFHGAQRRRSRSRRRVIRVRDNTSNKETATTPVNDKKSQRWAYYKSPPTGLKLGALHNLYNYLFGDDAAAGGGSFLRKASHPWLLLVVIATAATATCSIYNDLVGGRHYDTEKVGVEPIRRAVYFWFHAGPIVAHYKFTQWWLETTKAPTDKRHVVYQQLHDRYSGPSLKIILHLKGLYVKIGQVLSARPDFVPHQYVKLFSTVQDSIPQWPIEQVHSIMQESFRSELGLEVDDVLESMDATALGSASIGQVHRAVLRDAWCTPGEAIISNTNRNDNKYIGGREVAVKVMHPMAHDRFRHDFQVFRSLCRLALPGWTPILDELERRLMTEFDYRNEANNLMDVRHNMIHSPYRSKVCVPQPHLDLCTKHVLVMELLRGKKLTESVEDELAAVFHSKDLSRAFLEKRRAALLSQVEPTLANKSSSRVKTASVINDLRQARTSIRTSARLLLLLRKTRRWVNLLVDVHGYQIFHDGCFNGDPHPGNIMVLEDGRLGLIDFGQTRRLDERDRLAMASVVVKLVENNNNSIKDVAIAMRDAGFATRWNKEEMLRKYALLFFDSDRDSVVEGFATPQLYFAHLMATDPLVRIPDPAIFVARASYLFRGMGTMLEHQIRTSKPWSSHAHAALMSATRTATVPVQ